jgi:predicted molibdopterin-dependent oxidoreductase YjgC
MLTMADRDLSIYEPFSQLVRIEVEGRAFEVPENNILLRCFQYIIDEGVVLGRFCWNNECGNSEMSCRVSNVSPPYRARGCQTLVQEGMQLSELTPELRFWLKDKLK